MMPAIGLILPSLPSNTYPRIGQEGDDGSCAAACGAAQRIAPRTAIMANGVLVKLKIELRAPFQGYTKDAYPCLLSQRAFGVPTVHFSGVERCLEDEFIYGCPTLGAPAVIVGVDCVVVDRFVAATATATAAAPPTIRIHFNLPLLWSVLPEGSVLFVCCADVVTD